MTEGKQVSRSEYVTPKSEEEIIAKAIPKLEQIRTPREQSKQEITDKLIRLVFQGKKNFSEIAQEIGIGRTTAYTYWNDWKRTEEAAQVDWEWWSLYRRLKRVNPAKALECLTRIKYRLTTEKVEVKEEITETITKTYSLNYTEEDKNAILDAYRRINKPRSSTTEPDSLH